MSRTTILIILGIIVLAGGFVGYRYFRTVNESPYELVTVQKGNLIQEVSASGKVTPPTTIDLQFKNSGKLVELKAKVGKEIKAGDLLAKQDAAVLDAQLAEMQAGIDVQKAKLEQLQSGASPEDIAVAETAVANAEVSVTNARQALDDAKKDLENVKNKAKVDLDNLYDDIKDILNDAYAKAEDAVNRQTDDIFDNDLSSSPRLSFISVNSQAETDSEWQRVIAGNELKKFKTELDNLSPDYSGLDEALIKTKNRLVIIEDFLIRLNDAVHGASMPQTTINTYKTNINTGRTNINTAVSNINNQKQLIAAQKITNQKNIDSAQKDVNTAENNLKTAEGSLKTAQNQLILKKAPARSPDVALYEAQIRQAEAQMQKIQAQIQEMILTTPANGIITDTNGEVGEIVVPDTIVVSFMPSGNLQIKVNISEADVVNVSVGQEARITLDAFSDNTEWKGKVVSIDPAETIIGGAVYYKTTVLFDKEDERVRSGMTANVWVMTARKENALYIPLSAIKEKRGEKITDSRLYPYVEVLEGSQVKEKEVQTGMKGENGVIEIISGLNEGERIILSTKKK